MKILQSLAALAILIVLSAGVLGQDQESKAKASLEGTWKWTFTMPDGAQITPRLDLKQTNGQLTGTTRVQPGTETPVTNLTVNGPELSFQVVRARDGEQVVTRYTGIRSNENIKGKIVSNWNGAEQSYDWEAKLVSDANGTWKWSVGSGDRKFESKVTLAQDGEKVSGKIKSPRGEADIKKGKFKKGEISFEVERDRDGEKLISRYYGKLSGNKIEGKMELNFSGEPRTNKWEAVRAD